MKRLLSILVVGLLTVLCLPMLATAQQDEKAPPQNYAEVADQVAAIEAHTLAASQEALDLFTSGETDTLYARLSPEFQEVLTAEQLHDAYLQTVAETPLGERLDYRLMAANGSTIYVAIYAWGTGKLQIVVSINDADQVDGLGLSDVKTLPDDPAAGYHSAVTFRLPFDGLWYASWGGDDELHNYHVIAAPQRHANDFLVWKDGKTFSGEGTALEDYYAYGQPVLAPADGTVISAVDGLPDQTPRTGSDTQHPAGNHVVIQVAEGEYLFIAHMQPGSLQVQEGDTVTAGQRIGLCGNSGNTTEPHLHIHLQNEPAMFVLGASGGAIAFTDAYGLPLEFSSILVNGEPVERGEPLGGQFVQQGE